jgi:hypothetical protein
LLSLKEKELEPFPIKLEPWLEDEAMISKWKYLSQVEWKEVECGRWFYLYNPTL